MLATFAEAYFIRSNQTLSKDMYIMNTITKTYRKGNRPSDTYPLYAALAAERGVSTYRVSKDTGVNRGSIYEWKAGRSQPKADSLMRLADYFGVPIEYFLKGGETV